MERDDHKTESLERLEKKFIESPLKENTAVQYHISLIDAGEFERAEKVFQNALKLNPGDKRIKYLLIDTYLRQDKNQEAMCEIESAIRLFGFDDGILKPAINVRNRIGPMDIIKTAPHESTVSLCMIVKNEQKYISGCLASVKPIVDEMIVVDTGSMDKTGDIAKIFGAKVHSFQWSDDFSAARNFSISKASGRWIFIMDADEIISSKDYDMFRRTIKEAQNDNIAYSIVTRNYTHLNHMVGWQPNDGTYPYEEAGTGWIPSVKVRLFCRDERLRFQGPVHEMVESSCKKEGVQIKESKVFIHHYGKLHEKKDQKEEVYYQLGKKKLKTKMNDIPALREIAIQAGQLDKWDEAISLWNRIIDIDPAFGEAYINLASAFWNQGDYQKALHHSKKSTELVPHIKETRYNWAISYLMLQKTDTAISILTELVNEYPAYLPAKFMLSTAWCIQGNMDEAEKGYRVLQKTPVGPGLSFALYDMAVRLFKDQQFHHAKKLIQLAMEIKSSHERFEILLEKCDQALCDSGL